MSFSLNANTEKLVIASELDKYNSLFRTFWDCGGFSFKDTGTTTWLEHNEWGLSFCFNPTYYEQLTKAQRIFLCAHQLVHMVLEHPARTAFAKDKEKAKIATDIVVNHYLCDVLNFNRLIIDGWEELHWADTVFPGQEIPTAASWEYYYQLLLDKNQPEEPEKSEEKNDSGTGESAEKVITAQDDHTWWENTELVEEVTIEVTNIMGSAPIAAIQALLQTGTSEMQEAGWAKGRMNELKLKKVKVKRKWESVIKQWEKKTISSKVQEEDRWDRTNRRFHSILSGRNCFLPTEVEQDVRQLDDTKIEVLFFLDTSGSCFHLKERFFNAARTLNPKYFDVRLFAFDTAVAEVSLKSGKVYGGGGTAFDIIEAEIQRILKEKKGKYPVVWIITDGYGNDVHPACPQRWHWFLTEGNSTRNIPDRSKVFLLNNFE